MTTQLGPVLYGRVHRPGEDGYETHRKAFNPRLDARPLLVVEAGGPADVRAAVGWARDHDVPLAVQATGHGTHVPADGAVLLKTSRMATVLVDPVRRIARAGPGARWSDVIAAAAPFGLAPLSGTAPSVGVAGYLLGGGAGLLSRTFGFASDGLLRADVITADGEPVTATRDHNPELFWALRGGGGNFGVVTSLEFRLYPVARVHTAIARFPAERAAEVIARYRAWTAGQPDELSTGIVLRRGEPGTIKALYLGSANEFGRLLRPLWTAVGGPAEVEARTVTYAEVALPAIPPLNFDLYQALPDPVVEHLVTPDPAVAAVEIKHWGGAMARRTTDSGPAGLPGAEFSVAVQGPPASVLPIKPYAMGSFLNFTHDPAAVESAYTPANYRRLREIKRAYDPSNVFHLNLNIRPAGDSDDSRTDRPA